jgi:hypothetical protein
LSGLLELKGDRGYLGVVAVRGLVDIYGFHIGKVDRDGSFVSRGHYLECFYHMLKPSIDFLVLLSRGGQSKGFQAIFYDFAGPVEFVHLRRSFAALSS